MLGNRFPLKMKGKVYCCCVRSAMVYGSEAWCTKENEKAILRKTERAMVRTICCQKVVDRKTTEEQMDMCCRTNALLKTSVYFLTEFAGSRTAALGRTISFCTFCFTTLSIFLHYGLNKKTRGFRPLPIIYIRKRSDNLMDYF